MIEALMKRDRMIVSLGLLLVVALSWAYILTGASMDISGMMPPATSWTPSYTVLMFVMWWVMMMAMMLPSAAPMILLFETVNKNAASGVVPTFIFAGGYLLVWAGFSAVAILLQWYLTFNQLLNGMMQSTSTYFGCALLIAAGLYQFTVLKEACLINCRTPLRFVMEHWSPGRSGALKMGALHGIYCLGCCWFLMGLLFFGGVMNIVWIAGSAMYVLIEKQTSYGPLLGKIAGAGFIVWGGSLIWTSSGFVLWAAP